MHAISSRILIILSIALAILPACGRKTTPRALKSRGKKQIIAGSVLAGASAGAIAAAAPVIAHAGLGPIDIGPELAAAFYVLLPFAIITAPIAVALIVSGNEDRQEGRKKEKEERAKLRSNGMPKIAQANHAPAVTHA